METYLERVSRPEVDWDKGQPDDARRVHGEGYELGLVEVLGHLARLDGVHGAHHDQHHVVDERHQERRVLDAALEDDLAAVWVVVAHAGQLDQQPAGRGHQLDGDLQRGDHYLRARTNEARTLGRAGGRVEDPRYAVGLGEEGAVDKGEAQPDADPLQRAGGRTGLGQQQEGVEVADEYAGQQHIAQLAARRLHDWGVVVS